MKITDSMEGFEEKVVESLQEIKLDQKKSNMRLDSIEIDLHEHKSGVIELRKYVKDNDAVSSAKSMQTFMWFVGFVLAVMTFTVGVFFPLIFSMLNNP